jgi:undecaprenyl-diphosphatase
MEAIDAILLGIIQGFTEFLPVSSSGHLELGKAILGDNSVPEESLLFTTLLSLYIKFKIIITTRHIYKRMELLFSPTNALIS